MPDVLLGILCLISVVICIFIIVGICCNEIYPQWLLTIIVPFALITWFSASASQEWRYNSLGTFTVYQVDDVDCIYADGTVLNLNQYFGRNFKEGSTISLEKRDNGHYFGVWYTASPYYRITEAEKTEAEKASP